MQPALILGLGGTGIDIVANVRRSLLADRAVSPHVDASPQMLWIDTDTDYRVYTDTRSFPPQHTINIDGFTLEPVIRHLCATDPNFGKWWDCSVTRIPLFVPHRADRIGGRRFCGRLGLYYHFATVLERLHQMLGVALQPRPGPVDQALIILCTSLCGGTGSGIALDVAYLVRHLLVTMNRQATCLGVFLLPCVFERGTALQNDPRSFTRLRANSCATVKEVDHFAHHSYEFGPAGHEITFNGVEPFDAYWLVHHDTALGRSITDYYIGAASAVVNTVQAGMLPPAVVPAPLAPTMFRMWADWERAYAEYRKTGQSLHIDRRL